MRISTTIITIAIVSCVGASSYGQSEQRKLMNLAYAYKADLEKNGINKLLVWNTRIQKRSDGYKRVGENGSWAVVYILNVPGFLERCRTKYQAMFGAKWKSSTFTDLQNDQKRACSLVPEAVKRVKAALMKSFKEHLKTSAGNDDALLGRLSRGKKITQLDLEGLIHPKPVSSKTLVSDPEKYLKIGIDVARIIRDASVGGGKNKERGQKAIKSSMAKAKWPRCKGAPRQLVKAMKKAYAKANLKVSRVCLDGGWQVKTNRYGIPVDRMRNSWVLARGQSESFCRYYTGIGVFQRYSGGGRYERTYTVEGAPQGHFNLYVVRCK